ncbi:MAG: hypothetical protein ACRDDH_14475, partial [Cetobacterium sp.]|uniref:hypothetical protein n=1 Tax=Cetobacterium sp. TaxID=2071632 RepID=UPI003EE64EE0
KKTVAYAPNLFMEDLVQEVATTYYSYPEIEEALLDNNFKLASAIFMTHFRENTRDLFEYNRIRDNEDYRKSVEHMAEMGNLALIEEECQETFEDKFIKRETINDLAETFGDVWEEALALELIQEERPLTSTERSRKARLIKKMRGEIVGC